MYIIGTPIKSKDNLQVISGREFMKLYVKKFTDGLIKSTGESHTSHLYYESINQDGTIMIVCRF